MTLTENEIGSSLIEALAAITLLAIVGTGLTATTIQDRDGQQHEQANRCGGGALAKQDRAAACPQRAPS